MKYHIPKDVCARLADREGDQEIGAGSLDCFGSTGNRAQDSPAAKRGVNPEFVEAVAIAYLTRLVATTSYPLGPLRQAKLLYLSHRKADEDVTRQYIKKAAGPYSPWAKYKGPQKIAQENGYVKITQSGKFVGFVPGSNIEKIDQYVARYPVCVALQWVVEKFRFRKKGELELLTTVDFAALDLVQTKTPVTTENVKRVIASHKEWKPKLTREIFSDENIGQALTELRALFPGSYPEQKTN
jgi:hypothetical protein